MQSTIVRMSSIESVQICPEGGLKDRQEMDLQADFCNLLVHFGLGCYYDELDVWLSLKIFVFSKNHLVVPIVVCIVY